MKALYLLALSIFISKWIPDDYPVTNKMFKGSYSEIKSGPISSIDKAWFTNDSLHQTLVFELYTDYHRLVTYCFLNNEIPEVLLNRLELHVGSNLARLKQKQAAMPVFIKAGKRIDQKYFTSNKGLKMGDLKERAIKIYGKPDSSFVSKGVEVCDWKFLGDMGDMNAKGAWLVEESFGHRVRMIFKNRHLTGMILENDIP